MCAIYNNFHSGITNDRKKVMCHRKVCFNISPVSSFGTEGTGETAGRWEDKSGYRRGRFQTRSEERKAVGGGGGWELGGTDDQKACDSLGVRKRPVGQTHRRVQAGVSVARGGSCRLASAASSASSSSSSEPPASPALHGNRQRRSTPREL